MSSYTPTKEEKERFMSRAIELSNEGPSKGHGGPYGAVIVKDGKIIGEGYNRETIDCDPTGHGEMTAIRQACKNIKSCDLSGCEIYTSCEPCSMCTSAIWLCRINRRGFLKVSAHVGTRRRDMSQRHAVPASFPHVCGDLKSRISLEYHNTRLSVDYCLGNFSELDRVYYGNRLDDTKHILDLAPLVQHVASPIDQRSTTVEQVKGKEACDVITKWANDPNLNEYLLSTLGSKQKQ